MDRLARHGAAHLHDVARVGAIAELATDTLFVSFSPGMPDALQIDLIAPRPSTLPCSFTGLDSDWPADRPLSFAKWGPSDDAWVAYLPYVDARHEDEGGEGAPTVARIAGYYDRVTPLLLAHAGTTYQVCRLTDDGSARASNLAFAERAGVRDGERILDLGAGLCGPAVDIATRYAGVTIVATTISPKQATHAREIVTRAGLGDRIKIVCEDMHVLDRRGFDRILMFESFVYSVDPAALAARLMRALAPTGKLYIKDVFARHDPADEEQARALREFERLYVPRPRSTDVAVAALRRAGFADRPSADHRLRGEDHVEQAHPAPPGPPRGPPRRRRRR